MDILLPARIKWLFTKVVETWVTFNLQTCYTPLNPAMVLDLDSIHK